MFIALFAVILILVVLAATFHLYEFYILYNPNYGKKFVPQLGVLLTYSQAVPGDIASNISVYINNITTLKIGYEGNPKSFKIVYGVCVYHNLKNEILHDLIDAATDVVFTKTSFVTAMGVSTGMYWIKSHLIGKGSDADLSLAYAQSSFEDEVAERISASYSGNTKKMVKEIASALIMIGCFIPGYGEILMGIGIAMEAVVSTVLWILRATNWWQYCYGDPSYEFISGNIFNFYWDPSMKICNKLDCNLPFEIYPPDIKNGDYIVNKLKVVKKESKNMVIIYPFSQKTKK